MGKLADPIKERKKQFKESDSLGDLVALIDEQEHVH